MEFIKHYLVVAGIFVAIDAVWLTVVAKTFYTQQLGNLLRKKAKLPPAILFYVLYVAGMVIFALNPALGTGAADGQGSLSHAALYGGLLGLLMYATYDLTNLSTLRNWPVKVAIVDMIWGAFVTGLTVVLAFLIFN